MTNLDGNPSRTKRLALAAAAVVLVAAGATVLAKSAPRPSSDSEKKPAPTPPIVAVYHCRRGAEFHVSPDEAEVAVNGKVIGIADQWDDRGGGRQYLFDHAGWYYVRFKLRGYQTTWVKIEVENLAEKEIAKVKQKLPKKLL
ncbi:MAG TPA: hypothetical protein VGR00_10910 [Thermoanaerobaculia bacterium]|jgi:hypothetical protein|nr:hypothetical protein [Thermoanaerobaculia bacterium]